MSDRVTDLLDEILPDVRQTAKLVQKPGMVGELDTVAPARDRIRRFRPVLGGV